MNEFYDLPSHQFALSAHEWAKHNIGIDHTWEVAHSPVPAGLGDETILLPHDLHQIHGLLQSRDFGRRCFWTGDAKRFLDANWCEGWFDLWEIYDELATGPKKPVELIRMNGDRFLFPSVAEACRVLGLSKPGLGEMIKRRAFVAFPFRCGKRPLSTGEEMIVLAWA